MPYQPFNPGQSSAKPTNGQYTSFFGNSTIANPDAASLAAFRAQQTKVASINAALKRAAAADQAVAKQKGKKTIVDHLVLDPAKQTGNAFKNVYQKLMPTANPNAPTAAQRVANQKIKLSPAVSTAIQGARLDEASRARQMVAAGKSDADVVKFLKAASQARSKQTKQLAADTAIVATTIPGGPADLLINKGIGLLGKGAGAAAAKTGADVVAKQTAAKAAPYVSFADRAVRAGFQKTAAGITKGIEAVPGGSTALTKATSVKDAAMTKLVESMHPVFKAASQAEKAGVVSGGTKDNLDLLRGNVQGAARTAKSYIDNTPEEQKLLQSIRDIHANTKVGRKAFDDYTAATRELQLMDKGKKVMDPERYAKFKMQAKELRAQYGDGIETARKNLVAAEAKRSELLKGSGLSEQDLAHYKATDADYIRTQRKLDKFRTEGPYARPGSGVGAGMGKQKIKKYATQEALSPSAVHADSVFATHRFLAANELNKATVQLGKDGGFEQTALRTTANATTRDEMKASLRDSKPLRNELQRLVKTHGKTYRTLATEVNRLNKQGMDAYLKRGAKDESLAGKLVDPGVSMSDRELKNVIADLVNQDPDKLNAIKKKLAVREPKLAKALDDLNGFKTQLGQLSEQRAQQFLKMRGASDKASNGSPTISFWENGVKNTYKVPEEIAGAVNHYNQMQLGAFGEAVRALNNAFKFGTTTGNPAFAIPNYLKDQVSSSILSENVFKTHNPVAVVHALTTSVLNAGGKLPKGELDKYFFDNVGSSNLVDVTRNLRKAVGNVNAEINSTRSLAGQARNGGPIKTIKFAFNKNDDLINALENATRLQNFRGTYKMYKGKGYTDAEAKSRALLASRRNSIDFSASGDVGKYLNSLTPYLNAAIQGVRGLGRAVAERPATTTAKLVVATSPVIAVTQWNLSDPERAKMYAATPDYIRKANYVIIVGNKRYLIPMSQELQAVAGVARTVLEGQFGFDPKNGAKIAKQFVESLSPIETHSPLAAIGSILPPVLKSSIEVGTNKSFYTGQQIVPDYIKAKDEDPTKQTRPGVGRVSQTIANKLGVSPIQVDYMTKANLGELGGPVATNAIDKATGADQVGGRSVVKSVTRRFGVEPSVDDTKTQFNNVYYPLQSTGDRKTREINGLLYKGQTAKAQRIAERWNQQIDEAFKDYYRVYGKWADPAYKDRIGGLKIDLKTSKKGKTYIKY